MPVLPELGHLVGTQLITQEEPGDPVMIPAGDLLFLLVPGPSRLVRRSVDLYGVSRDELKK